MDLQYIILRKNQSSIKQLLLYLRDQLLFLLRCQIQTHKVSLFLHVKNIFSNIISIVHSIEPLWIINIQIQIFGLKCYNIEPNIIQGVPIVINFRVPEKKYLPLYIFDTAKKGEFHTI